MSQHDSLTERISRHALCQPDAPALLWHGEVTTYARLHRMMWGAYREIVDVAPGPIGVLARKSPRSVALILGANLARRTFLVPAAGLPADTLRSLFGQGGAGTVVSPDTDWDEAHATLVDVHVDVPAADPAGPVAPDDPDRVSFVLTTSGSTGVPKIVPLTIGAVDRFAEWAHRRFDLGPGRSVLNYAPLNFDLCLFDIWATLANGGCVVLVDADNTSDGRLLAQLVESPVHVIEAVPMLYELLTAAAGETGDQLETPEHVLFTGDAIRPGCLAELPKLFPNARFYNLYGCTETNDSFLHEVSVEAEHADPLALGEPLPGVRHLVVAEDGNVVDGPGVGELYVATPFQTTGYLNASRAEKFVPHPRLADDRRYFRSGDLVRRHDDGRLTVEGRNDFQVKIRGQQVNIQAVERVLLGHEAVLEAAVVAVPHPSAGRRLEAVVRRRPDQRLTALDVRAFCAQHLPAAAIPAKVRITDRPLPRTATGKTDRRNLGGTGADELAAITLTLTDEESAHVRRVCLPVAERLRGQQLDSEPAISAIELAGCELPARLVGALSTFRCVGNAAGTLVIRNLPVDAGLPPTPADGNLADWGAARLATVAQLAAASHLGDVIGFADEKRGRLVQDIVPVRGADHRQENSGTVFLELHTENGFHPFKPDFLTLLCLRPDTGQDAATITSSLTAILPELDESTVDVLRQPLFRIRYASSFTGSGPGWSRPLPVLSGPPAQPELVADFHAMRPLRPEAAQALARLEKALRGALVRVRSDAGTLLVVDNRVAVHGRTAFAARYDGTDRWLRRCFVVADLRRSRGSRRSGSRVCEPLDVINGPEGGA